MKLLDMECNKRLQNQILKYNSAFIAKIKASKKEIENGSSTRVKKEELKHYLGLKFLNLNRQSQSYTSSQSLPLQINQILNLHKSLVGVHFVENFQSFTR
jgi:hypothetical protein